MKNIPIIGYQHIRDRAESQSVSVGEFERQIAYLKKRGYEFLSLDEYVALKCDTKSLESSRQRYVLILFEGAWRDFYTNAVPILQHYWAKVGVFIATEWIDEASKQEQQNPMGIQDANVAHNEAMLALSENPRSVVCTWEELAQVRDFVSIGSMTHTYQLSNYVAKPWHEDLQLSKNLISQHLGVRTTHLLWPRGEYDATLLRTAKKMEFNAFYLKQTGLNLQDSVLEENSYYTMRDGLWHLKKFLFVCENSFRYKALKAFL